MGCYMDKTYCDFFNTCKNGGTCHRSATDKVYQDAKEFGLPLCRFIDKPDCHKEID